MIKKDYASYATEDELLFSLQLNELNIKYKEQIPFIIDKGFTKTNGKKYRDSIYTPDFIIEHNNITYIIEIKGWSMFDDPFKYRIAEKTFLKLGYKFYKLKISGSTKDGTYGFYDYSSGFKNSALTENNKIIKKVSKQFLYNKHINTLQITLKPLKRLKKYTYDDVYELTEVEYYKKHLDNSEMPNEFFDSYIKDNYYFIGKYKDISKLKFIKIDNQ